MTPFRLSTTPVVGCKSCASNFNKVDFPAPFGPTNATRLSISIPKSTFFKISISVPGYRNVTSLNGKTGGAIFAPQSGNLNRNEFRSALGSGVKPAAIILSSTFFLEFASFILSSKVPAFAMNSLIAFISACSLSYLRWLTKSSLARVRWNVS